MKLMDILSLPLRFLLSNDRVDALGLTSVQEERMRICARYAKEPVLDIGCGEGNLFIRRKGLNGQGLDIFPYRGVDICASSYYLPFKNGVFHTITFIGSLNYHENPGLALKEAKGVLNWEGRLLITNTNSLWSSIRHAFAWWKPEQYMIKKGMRYGFSNSEIIALLTSNGFIICKVVRYFLGISSLYVASPYAEGCNTKS